MAKIFVVGLGPGGVEQMTKRAIDALNSCDVIAGYHVYVNLIKGRKLIMTDVQAILDQIKEIMTFVFDRSKILRYCSKTEIV